jgi:hypothetical protein
MAMLASAVLATSVMAGGPTWKSPVNVRQTNFPQLQDADFSNHNVAITWHEPGAGHREVGIRTSVDNGSGFGPISWFTDSRESAVDICGGSELNAVMAHRIGPGNWFIEHAVGSIDGDGFITTPVAPSDGIQSDPDVACAGGRVFVSWFEPEGSGHRLFVAHANRSVGTFGTPIDLGFDDETDFFSGLAVAGVSNRAYAVFQRSNGDLRFKRWSIGGGPGFAVTPHATQVIGNGTPNNPASYPVIAAAGDKVAVAWFRCGALWARVSNNRGQTWGPARKLIEHAACDGDFIAVQQSIAIRGGRIVVAYGAAGIVGDGEVGLFSTKSDFANFSDNMIADKFRTELVGFVTVSGDAKLASAFSRGDRVRFRRQI